TLLVSGEAPVPLSGGVGAPRAAAVHTGELLVLTDEALSVVASAQLAHTPLADALDGVPAEMAAAGGALWVRTAGGVWLHRDGSLGAVTVAGRTLTGPLAAGVDADGVPLAWIGAEGRLVAVDVDGAVRADRVGAVDDVATDAAGRVWVASEGELAVGGVDGPWRRFTFADAVTAVAADPGAAGAWVLAGGTVYRGVGGESPEAFEVLASDVVPDGIAADPLGRLLAWDGDLHRVTAGRVIEVIGLTDGDEVNDGTVVTLLPTAPDEVDAVTATIDGTALDVAAGGDGTWSVTIDAATWAGEGSRALVAEATYAGGRTASSGDVRFSVGALGDVTWTEHVGPLAQQHCAVCHAGDTATLLDDAATWQARVDDILAQVEAGSMPLSADPLPDGEIALIRAWRDGGFLP
ncbi:MAG: hypothetical protein ACK4YP_03275, partial [Myxococcota bacterium]